MSRIRALEEFSQFPRREPESSLAPIVVRERVRLGRHAQAKAELDQASWREELVRG